MKQITSDTELQTVHRAGRGLLYNDFSGRGKLGWKYNVLHQARCRWILTSNANVPKYHFEDLTEAAAWLTAHRGTEDMNWKRCRVCCTASTPPYEATRAAAQQTRSSMPTVGRKRNLDAADQSATGGRYEIRRSSDAIDLWRDTRFPLQRKGELAVESEIRIKLRDALFRLDEPPLGRVLAATYTSLVDSFCDVENVLIYNVGPAHFANATRYGLRFERRYASPPDSPGGRPFAHHHHYGFREAGLTCTASSACSFEFPIDPLTASSRPHAVWWAASGAAASSVAPIDGAFELQLVLSTPTPLANLAVLVKPLLDGVICALHSESDPDPHAVERLAGVTGWDAGDVVRRLQSPANPMLGPRRLLRTSPGGFVTWNPADDRCVRCTILVERGASWRCRVDVMPKVDETQPNLR